MQGEHRMISAPSIEILKQFIFSVRKKGEKASLVFLTYNRWEYTEMTLNSIFKNTFFPHDFIVVDNHSTDGTVEKLKQLHRQGKIDTLILLPRNYGLYAGFNIGWKYGNDNSWLSVLPNDVLVSPYWLTALCYVASHLKAGGVVATPFSSKVRNWAAGRKIGNIGGMKIVRTGWATNPPVMTKATFQKIGYFREDIGEGKLSFYGIGDTEYSERATKLGVGTYYILDLDCKHISSINLPKGMHAYEIEKQKYPEYTKWKSDTKKIKLPKWFKGKYPRYKKYETRFSKEWIAKYVEKTFNGMHARFPAKSSTSA